MYAGAKLLCSVVVSNSSPPLVQSPVILPEVSLNPDSLFPYAIDSSRSLTLSLSFAFDPSQCRPLFQEFTTPHNDGQNYYHHHQAIAE